MQRDRRRLMLKTLKHHAPLSDSQLCWLMKHLEVNPSTTCRLRRQMTREGLIQFAKKIDINGRGHGILLWELTLAGQRKVEEWNKWNTKPSSNEAPPANRPALSPA